MGAAGRGEGAGGPGRSFQQENPDHRLRGSHANQHTPFPPALAHCEGNRKKLRIWAFVLVWQAQGPLPGQGGMCFLGGLFLLREGSLLLLTGFRQFQKKEVGCWGHPKQEHKRWSLLNPGNCSRLFSQLSLNFPFLKISSNSSKIPLLNFILL